MSTHVLCLLSVLASAGSISIERPRPGEALQETQTFVIGYEGAAPVQVDFYLNGRLVRSRLEPPFEFTVTWDTTLENRARVEARWADGSTDAVEGTYREIAVDVAEKVSALRCFPYFNGPPAARVRFAVDGRRVEPQTFEPADALPLSLVVALDVSGSMKFFLPELSGPLADFMAYARDRGYRVKLVVFDRNARLINRAPADLATLYRSEGLSVVWNAVATAAQLFEPTPRRAVLLISDGADDGSEHNAETAAAFLRKSRASLIWLAPSDLSNRSLTRLARRSGGFRLQVQPGEKWSRLERRLSHQRHLLIAGVEPAAALRISPGPAWWPAWR